MSYDLTPDEAFREALELLTSQPSPRHFRYAPDDAEQYEELMVHLGKGSPLGWATSTSTIECAEKLVLDALENGNLKPRS